MRTPLASTLAALGALWLAVLGADAPGPPPDPDTIFANARAAWAAGAYPRYATYVAVVDYQNGAQHRRRTWETVEDFRHALVFSHTFSREEIANPAFPPKGFNIAIPFFPNADKPRPDDPVGHVAFAIDQGYGLGLSSRHLKAADSGAALDAASSGLSTIGRTGVIAPQYAVRLIETLDTDHGTEFHLGLTALRDPERNRLRELWIDAGTWQAEAAIVAGIGNRSPFTDVSWRIDFMQIDGATYIARETALGIVDYGDAGKLSELSVTFAEFAAHPMVPSTFTFGVSSDDPLADP
jgi:hypothetical protein